MESIYLVKIGGINGKSGYYSEDKPYELVSKNNATSMTYSHAMFIVRNLRKLGYTNLELKLQKN